MTLTVLRPIRIVLCLALWLAPGWGATLELLSINDLITKSSAIIRGQVTGVTASYTGPAIYTHYQVSVTQQWKGAAQTSFDVLVPGGTAKGNRQVVPGAPQLRVGQQYVLFLWTSSTGLVYTLGFTQGVFNLLQDSSGNLTASQMLTTETVLAPVTGQVATSRPISMPLAQLISLIASGGGA